MDKWGDKGLSRRVFLHAGDELEGRRPSSRGAGGSLSTSLRFRGSLRCRSARANSRLLSSATNSKEKDCARLFCLAICVTKSTQFTWGKDLAAYLT